MEVAKVRDFPDLLKRGGGIVNTNHDEYLRAKSRIRQSKRIETLELELGAVHRKLDLLINLMASSNERKPT